jgi:hypothetical protein
MSSSNRSSRFVDIQPKRSRTGSRYRAHPISGTRRGGCATTPPPWASPRLRPRVSCPYFEVLVFAPGLPPLPMPRAEPAVHCLVPIVHHRPDRIRPAHVVLGQQRWLDPDTDSDAPDSGASSVSRRSCSIDGLEWAAVAGQLPARLCGYSGPFVAVGSDRNVLAGQAMTIGETGRKYASSGGRGHQRIGP